jgi:hypothetical protein
MLLMWGKLSDLDFTYNWHVGYTAHCNIYIVAGDCR